MNINNWNNWKLYSTIIFLIIVSGVLIWFLFQFNLRQSIQTVLEVNENKECHVTLDSSNIELVSTSKSVILRLENKSYLIENVEFISLGNRKYLMKFENEKLLEDIKPQTFFNIRILFGTKNIFQTIFNII